MADSFRLDADIYIPTGVDATPQQVADMVIAGDLPAESLTKIAEDQQPEPEHIDAAIEASDLSAKEAEQIKTAIADALDAGDIAVVADVRDGNTK